MVFLKKELHKVGFNLREVNDKIIIPNFFEPFKKQNFNMAYGYLLSKNYKKKKIKFFKGDSDMDRPNSL